MNRPAVLTALLAAILFGISTPIAKGLLGVTSPQVLAGLLYLGSGLGLGLWFLIRRTGRSAPTTSKETRSPRDWPWLAGAIFFGGIIGPFLLMFGLERSTSSSASLLLNLEGVFTALIAWVVFRENADRRIIVGMLAIVAGGALLSWEGRLAVGSLAGPLAVAGACLAWGIDNNLTQKVSASDPVRTAALKGLVAGSVNLAIGLARGGALPPVPLVGGALLLGLLSYGISLVLFITALRDLGTARTGAYFSLAPFVGAATGLILWREPFTPLILGAAALMAIGLWIHLTEAHAHHHVHEPLEHRHRHHHDIHHQHEHGPDDPPGEPHTHWHRHEPLEHTHPHYPDIHHRHRHGRTG
ncbi:MAG: DMT family transporter [Candidatus Eisenbacteria bacterium]|nr:DMT family transporter [Candidatus Eisenbacteria bacterium]